MINIISDNLLKAYVRNMDGLENLVVEKIRQQLGLYKPMIMESMLEAGYMLHVLGRGESITDVPELKRKRSLRDAAGYCGDPSESCPMVISVRALHPEGNVTTNFPNTLVHEIGHAIPKFLMTESERGHLRLMHRRAKRRYREAKREGVNPLIPDIRYLDFSEEYLPVGLEFSVQKEPLGPPIVTRVRGPDGKYYLIPIEFQFSGYRKEIARKLFHEISEDYQHAHGGRWKREVFRERRDILREPYGLPRSAASLKISDPELLAFCRQFLNEDRG